MFKERRKQNPDEIPTEQTQKVNDDYQAFIENKNDTTNINRKELYKIFKYDEFPKERGIIKFHIMDVHTKEIN